MIIIKKCNKCLEYKEDNCFYKRIYKNGIISLEPRCIKCKSDYYKKHFRKTFYSHRNRRRSAQLKHHYGISLEDYNHILNNQAGVCAICKLPSKNEKRLAVDHCHSSGRIRGLLCDACNLALGKFKDNIESLKKAIEYLLAGAKP